MELLSAEEIFEVNSNSTTDTLKEQRLARNKDIRLKATYLVSRRPVKAQQKEYNSESSSEFPASSPSNPQMQRKSQYQTRPPLLKNTLPTDTFERGLALIATKEPQMSTSEKIESWQCVTDEFSDVEDVVNFDAAFEQREENKIKALSKTKYELKNKTPKEQGDNNVDSNETCYSFTEFQRRLLAIDPRKSQSQCNEQKHHHSKLTSEEDEKPTTSSNYLTRNRDTPFKKRACKYKRAAEPISHLPNKKSSSSDTPRDGAPSPKKKVQQSKTSGTACGAGVSGGGVHLMNEKMVCPSSSDASSHLLNRNNHINTGSGAKNFCALGQGKSKSTKVIDTNPINTNWNRTIATTRNAPCRSDDQEAFFRWRRLSRERDKFGSTNRTQQTKTYQHFEEKNPPTSVKQQGLIQIRYDFLAPNRTSTKTVQETNSYNVVVKPLKNCKTQQVIFKEPPRLTLSEPKIRIEALLQSKHSFSKGESAITRRTDQPRGTQSTCAALDKKGEQDSDSGFNQQHEFCNYLGLTGMSTATAMATAAAELSRCNIARRSLRVRHLEQRKAKNKSKPEVFKEGNEQSDQNKTEITNTMLLGRENEAENSGNTENTIETSSSKFSPTPNADDLESHTFEDKREENKSTVRSATMPSKLITKEKDPKIKILCQISACSKENGKINRGTNSEQYLQRRKSRLSDVPALNTTIGKPGCDLHEDQCDRESIKCLELLQKYSSTRKTTMDEVDEIQTLHKKVQKCLKEARENVPNICIIQSYSTDKDHTTIEKDNWSDCKRSTRSQSKIPVNKVDSKEKKRIIRPNIKKKASSRNKRQLYTRSMLNLNQQRELRNRKVILKILKTYSGLKIKLNKPKNKQNTQFSQKQNQKRNNGNLDSTAPNSDSESMDTSNIDQLSPSPITSHKAKSYRKQNTAFSTSSKKLPSHMLDDNCENVSKTVDEPLSTIKDGTNAAGNVCENSQGELLATTPSNISPTKNSAYSSDMENKIPFLLEPQIVTTLSHNKTTEVAVQTDPIPITQSQQTVSIEKREEDTLEAIQLGCVHAEVEVCSSDMVTSTTTICDQSRCDAKILPQLVAKGQYENFILDENNVVPDALPSKKNNQSTAIDPLPQNVSINASINEFGVHELRQPRKALRNPLQTADGSVLHIFYELDVLIVIQEALVSFWKYIRVLNALSMYPQDDNNEESNRTGRQNFSPKSQPSTDGTNYDNNPGAKDKSIPISHGCEWLLLGDCRRLSTDIEICSPYINRLCLSESRPVYIEMRCRDLSNEFRECDLLSCYVNVYFYNEEDQVAMRHSIQLDSIQSLPSDVIYTSINESRYFVLAWPQANVLGKVRSGLCKYALTPELDMLATTRDFKAMRHALRSLECLNDGKLLGFGDTQLTVWDHRSGDVLMNFDLSLPLGKNLGTIYYPSCENDQNNIVIMIQHVRSDKISELVIIACIISHNSPSRRVLLQHKLPVPPFQDIRYGINNGEHFIIQSGTGEEILINCNDPRQFIFVPAQKSEHFYTRGRTQVIEVTKETLTVDSFSSYLLNISMKPKVEKEG